MNLNSSSRKTWPIILEDLLNLETVKKPKQARSKARREALIEYGSELLNTCDLDEISVADVTSHLGYSTGSFYSYFRDKEAFFIAVQQWVNDDLGPEFSRVFVSSQISGYSLTERLGICLDFALDYFRKRTGIIRNALRYERRIPAGWAPNRSRTKAIIKAASINLDTSERQKLEIALQLSFGLLVNAVLHDPGPLGLTNKNLKARIQAALEPYLE